MQLSRMRMGIFTVLTAVVVLAAVSAGCVGNIDLTPSEVQNHGSVIAVDPHYVDPATIVELLVNPSSYQPGLFTAIEKYVEGDKPVVEVGAGLGVGMAAVSKELKVPKKHVVVTPNPHMFPLLEETIAKNSLVVDLQQKAIAYDVETGELIPFTVSKNLQENMVGGAETEEIVMVPATTVSDIIAGSSFADATDITLIVEAQDLVTTILENEPQIYDHVGTIIALTTAATNQDQAKIMNKALIAGYSPVLVTEPDTTGLRAIVLVR